MTCVPLAGCQFQVFVTDQAGVLSPEGYLSCAGRNSARLSRERADSFRTLSPRLVTDTFWN